MTITTALLTLLFAGGIMFLIWKFVQNPGWKNGLLIACGIGLVIWLFDVLNLWNYLSGTRI